MFFNKISVSVHLQNMNRFLFLILASVILATSCSRNYPGIEAYEISADTPDYHNLAYWASHPGKKDYGDNIPSKASDKSFEQYPIDVFFIHPTTYTRKRSGADRWNASLTDQELNKKTDESTILYQASIFNGTGRLFAPRYRQAHITSFFRTEGGPGKAALDLAYEDVKEAFSTYLESQNQGRPFIIASHSQGTFHAKRLIAEFVDGKPLQDQLVAAYLVGIPVEKDLFDNIEVCSKPEQTRCFCSWRTFRSGFIPSSFYPAGDHIAVTNPVTWTVDKAKVPKEAHQGAVLRNFNKIFSGIVSAQIHEGLLWIDKPKFPWSFLFTRKNYHIADLNFFYIDVRENSKVRAMNYLKERS